jgi:hypothetical protein
VLEDTPLLRNKIGHSILDFGFWISSAKTKDEAGKAWKLRKFFLLKGEA